MKVYPKQKPVSVISGTRRTIPVAPSILWTVLAAVWLWPSLADAQSTWEYAPYRVKLWVAMAPQPQLTDVLSEELQLSFVRRARVVAGATWDVTPASAPGAVWDTMVTDVEALTVAEVETSEENALDCDKIFFITIDTALNGYRITARELDCNALILGHTVRIDVAQHDRLGHAMFEAAVKAFTPLLRVEDARAREAIARPRAGGLVVTDEDGQSSNPSHVQPGDVFQPVVRRNDRYGKPAGVQLFDWTYMHVTSQEGQLLTCEVSSSRKNPLTGRSSARTMKLALGVRPADAPSTLRLVSRGNTDEPLEGYEVYAKSPLLNEQGEQENAVKLGRTDWNGRVVVPPGDFPVRLVYVKNGSYLLARLPIVPGQIPEMEATLTNDDKRLEAEAFVRGMESTVMDLVARRHIIAARIRQRLSDGRFDEAKQMMEEFRQMETKADLELMITSRQSALASGDDREQRLIDNLLTGTRTLLSTYLNDDLGVRLAEEVNQAAPGAG